jgi:hypothetical protein
MSFETGAWIAGILGIVTGLTAERLTATPHSGRPAWLDALIGAVVGLTFALVAYGVFAVFEGWAAFFQRPASAVLPLLFTSVMLVASLAALWVVRRRKRP